MRKEPVTSSFFAFLRTHREVVAGHYVSVGHVVSEAPLRGIPPVKPFRALALGLFLLAAATVPAKVNFSDLDLSTDNRLLFRAHAEGSGAITQNALFISRLTDLTLQQITAFPEKMNLIDRGRILQIENSFGTYRIPIAGGLPRNVKGSPAFTEGAPVLGGRVEALCASGDGKWLLYVEPLTPAYGNLVLIDTATGGRTLITGKVERPGALFPACWSPDSRVFVYSRGGRLYYHTIGASANRPVDEQYRLIGEGSINSVAWSGTGDFFYIRGSTVYQVRGAELFARSVYADFLEMGQVAGKIPFEFDYNFDAFTMAPDSRSLLLMKGERNIFYFPLGLDDYTTEMTASLPYIMLPRAASNLTVLWSPQGLITVLASIPADAAGSLIAYSLSLGRPVPGASLSFRILDAPPASSGLLSPDGSKAVFWGPTGITLYDYVNWKVLQVLSPRPAYGCIWLGNEELIIADSARIERLRVSNQAPAFRPPGPDDIQVSRSPICLSQVQNFGFEEFGERIFARTADTWYATNGTSPWVEITDPSVRPTSQVSGRYRVFLERQSTGPYENIPMIRNAATTGTVPLLSKVTYADAPAAGESWGGGLRELSVCFDLYDDAAGLSTVLDVLRKFGIRATFFLNGEFIRRHPAAVKDIAESSHETASMFFAPIDLSDARYQIQGDFIARGLARNEDEYFKATSREMGSIWHAPYYAISSEIIAAAAEAGYITVGRDVDPMDWVTRDLTKTASVFTQPSASDMIDRIIDQKRPGSVIPIRLGLLPGGRSDYLYNRLSVLLDALVRSGYSIVPLSTLIEHAK
ncbi:polysaccharide deacetylase [Spirochaetia bacterium]|nr:polysaccharide deacetylase [Spirochaetia bacterium]